MGERKFAKKGDIIVLALLLIICGSFLFSKGNSGSTAEILYDGEVLEKVDLSKNQVISPNINLNVAIEVKDGGISFISSDCPDKVCINTGVLHYEGESAACLPNKLSVRIVKGEKSPVDTISK